MSVDIALPLSARVIPIVETERSTSVVIEGKSKHPVHLLREAVRQTVECGFDALIRTHG